MRAEIDEQDFLELAKTGDKDAVGRLLELYRGHLLRIVQFRISPQIARGVDASDVIQEAFTEINQRLPEYLRDQEVPFFVWARFIVLQRLAMTHRQHVEVKTRAVGREAHRDQLLLNASSESMAGILAASMTSPSQAMARDETVSLLHTALDALADKDREIIALRHFEQLNNSEAAEVLGISNTAACNRYVRGLERLRSLVDKIPGFAWSFTS